MEKIRLKCISIAKDGGSKRFITEDCSPESLEQASRVIENAYYLDGAFGSPTRGKFFSKHPKNYR